MYKTISFGKTIIWCLLALFLASTSSVNAENLKYFDVELSVEYEGEIFEGKTTVIKGETGKLRWISEAPAYDFISNITVNDVGLSKNGEPYALVCIATSISDDNAVSDLDDVKFGAFFDKEATVSLSNPTLNKSDASVITLSIKPVYLEERIKRYGTGEPVVKA